ncbi:MAG: Dabb family protein [Pseudolysinimonas sp.]
MILHIASFRWKDEVTPDDVAALTDALRSMAAGISELRSSVCGENLRLRPGADYGVAAIVEDAAALGAYLDSEAHKQVYETYLGWMIAERSAAQLPVSESGSL